MVRNIVILFPRTGEIPIGGFKVVYEYGNRLAEKGIHVTYIYGVVSRCDLPFFIDIAYRVCRYPRFLVYKYLKDYKPTKWFSTNTNVIHKLAYSLSERYIGECDVVMATSWATAYWLDKYKKINSKDKFYFIQHFEDWHGGKEKVLKTWKMDLNKIVIAPWLQKIAEDLGEKSYLVENAFDHTLFYLTNCIEDRNKNLLMMLWHDNPFKGCSIGLEALGIVKKLNLNLEVIFFGVSPRPSILPSWMDYYRMPDKTLHRELYNKAAIFVGPSYSEGWGLTVGEAMLCGCAIACTNNDGYTILAEDKKTALLSDIGDAKGLANNIIELIKNDQLRVKIAYSGLAKAKNYTWEQSFKKLFSIINNRTSN